MTIIGFIKAFGNKIKEMEKDFNYFQIEIIIKVIFVIINLKEKEYFNGNLDKFMMDNGKMG